MRGSERGLRRQARAGGLYVLNFDGIGIDGKLYLAETDLRGLRRRARPPRSSETSEVLLYPEGRLAGLVREVCGELGLPLGRLALVGAMFDHAPFACGRIPGRGFDAVSLTALGRASWAIHTPGDTADKLHIRGFEQVGRVALAVVERLTE